MTRPLRIEFEGAFYHIISRGNEKSNIYRDKNDRKNFIDILRALVKRFQWKIHTYCLMDNHYHLLLETPLPNLSAGMRQLNGIYTQRFNRKWNRVGHLYQGRFKSYIIDKDSYLLELCRYIVLNPLQDGKVKNIEDWEWSSYHTLGGFNSSRDVVFTDTIWSYFSNKVNKAQKQFRDFIYAGIGKDDNIHSKARGGFILGGEDFTKTLVQMLKTKKLDEIKNEVRYPDRPEMDKIFNNKSRNEGIGIAINQWGYGLQEVGGYVNLHYSTISRIAKKNQNAKNKT